MVCFGPGLAECAHAFLFCAYLEGSFFGMFKFFSWLHSGLKQASMKDRFHFLTTDWSGFDGVAFQERAIAVKKSGTCRVVALQLIRRLDAVGAPYSICVARCQRAPGGLHLGLLQGGAQQYCVDTMRQTGDAEQSRAAAQKGSGKKGWGNNSGWSGNSGNSGWSGWGGSGSKGGSGGWGKPSGQGTGWGAPLTTTFQGPVRPGPGMATQAPPQAASQAAPQAAPQASAAPEADPWAGWETNDDGGNDGDGNDGGYSGFADPSDAWQTHQ